MPAAISLSRQALEKPFRVRLRAFRIWQALGYFPWRKEKERKARKKQGNDFYKGAFDDIPFLNNDAKRTFAHLLLRPGYMIRDYVSGQHERYLAPFASLIIFYAFFALISAVLQPLQQDKKDPFERFDATIEDTQAGMTEEQLSDSTQNLVLKTYQLLRTGYIYLHLDQYPDEVDTRHEASIAAFESKLRSQGIPLFLGKFFVLWFAMWLALRRYKQRLPACSVASAYTLCQFSFFMLFAVLTSLGKQTSISVTLMLVLLTVDYRQWLGIPWKKSLGRAVATGIWYGAIYFGVILVISILLVLLAYWT